MLPALQVVETFKLWDDAYAVLRWLAKQEGYFGGRLYYRENRWHVQTFHDATGVDPTWWLPDGVKHVLVPQSLARTLGINS